MKKKIIGIVLIAALAVGVAGCSNGKVNSNDDGSGSNISENAIEYKKISPGDAKARLDQEEGIILLDVRTEEEFDEKHITGAIRLQLDFVEEEVEEVIKDKETVVFVYCRSGRRSKEATKIMVELGYENVYDLGGINDWNYETE